MNTRTAQCFIDGIEHMAPLTNGLGIQEGVEPRFAESVSEVSSKSYFYIWSPVVYENVL
jgi:hypothetical protein